MPVIILPNNDPWANIGEKIGQGLADSYKQRLLNKETLKAMGLLSEAKNNYNNPGVTDAETQAARKQIVAKYNLDGILGNDPMAGIVEAQDDYGLASGIAQAQKDYEAAHLTGNNDAMSAAHQKAEWLRQDAAKRGISLSGLGADDNAQNAMDIAHQKAELFREIAKQKGINLNGFSSDDDARTAYSNYMQSQQTPQKPGASTFDIGYTPKQDYLGQIGQGLMTGLKANVSSAAQPGSFDLPKMYANRITMNDIDQLSGGTVVNEMKSIADAMAKQRVQKDFNSQDFVSNLYKSMLEKGLSPEAIAKVMPIGEQFVANLSNEQRQAQAMKFAEDYKNAVISGDSRLANAIVAGYVARTGGKPEDLVNLSNKIAPDFEMKTVDNDGYTTIATFDKHGGKGGSFVNMPKTINPTKAHSDNLSYKGKVESADITGQYGLRKEDVKGRYGLAKEGQKQEGKAKSEKPPTYVGDLRGHQTKIQQLLDAGDIENAGQEIDSYLQKIEKYSPQMDNEDLGIAKMYGYYYNAVREAKAGNMQKAKEYASALPPELRNRLGL